MARHHSGYRVRSEKEGWVSSGRFQTITQVGTPGTGFRGTEMMDDIRLQLQDPACTLVGLRTHQAILLQQLRPTKCTSSTPQANPGSRSTTPQTRLKSRRQVGSNRQQVESQQRLPNLSIQPEALVHPVFLTAVERDAGHMSICQTRDKNYQRKTFYFQVSMEILQTCRLKHLKFLVTI